MLGNRSFAVLRARAPIYLSRVSQLSVPPPIIRKSESEPSGEELIALIGALRAENASLKARIAELERRLVVQRRVGALRLFRGRNRV